MKNPQLGRRNHFSLSLVLLVAKSDQKLLRFFFSSVSLFCLPDEVEYLGVEPIIWENDGTRKQIHHRCNSPSVSSLFFLFFSWITTILPFQNFIFHPFFPALFFCWSQVCVEIGVKTFSFWISHFPVVRLRRLRRRPFDQELFIHSVRVVFVLLAPLCAFHLFVFSGAVLLFFPLSAQSVRTRGRTLPSPSLPPLIISRG